MRVHCLANPSAGRHGERTDAIERAFAACGVPSLDLVVEGAGAPGELEVLARRALAAKADVVVAAGGDGTVSAIASVLAGSDAALGVLPLGTLNHFARDLGIPQDLAGAVAVVCAGKVSRIDLGEVNGRRFVNNSSLGLYPEVVRTRDRWQPRVGKWPAFAAAAVVETLRRPALRVDLEVDGERFRRRAPLVFVGNNAYAVAWPEAGRRERLDQACLTLALLRDVGIAALGRSTVHLLRGSPHLATEIDVRRASRVVVHARGSRARVAIDGEVVRIEPPLVYRVLPGALRVCVP